MGLLGYLLVWLLSAPGAHQPPTFSTRIEAVRVDVLVTAQGRPVTGLTAADFELRDNGVVQAIDLFSFEQVPLNVVLVLDLSASVSGPRLENLRRAGHALLDGTKPRDQTALITMTHAVRHGSALSANPAGIRAALDAAVASGGTSLVDASFAALTLGKSDVGRALVMVFSDGEDTSSWLPAERVLEAAKRSEAVVYGISPGRHRSRFLPDLVAATGGRMLQVDASGDLAPVFVGILQEFRDRYLLSYVPRGVERGGWHRLDVRVRRRGVRVQARPGYAGDA